MVKYQERRSRNVTTGLTFVSSCYCCVQVNESEHERLESELEHMKVAQQLNEAEQRVKKLQRDWKRNIAKSRHVQDGPKNVALLLSISSPIIDQFSNFSLAHPADNLQ